MKKLTKQIQNKLNQLNELLDQIDEARIIQPDEPETWEADILADLLARCQEVIELLEDKKHPHDKDSWDDPLILEPGLYSLMNTYLEEDEEEADD